MNVKWTNDWEQRKLRSVAHKTYGGGTPKTSEEEFWNGTIPWFQSADLIEHEVQSTVAKKAITELGLQKSAAQLIPGNSIAIVTRVGVGKLTFMAFPYATSQDFLSLSELNIDERFGCYAIYRLLQREKNFTQGTSIKGITKDELLNKIIDIPNREEQQKIGRYFTALDHLITLHQWKCYFYEIIRLNDWEQRKLLDCIQKITDFRGRTPKKLGMNWSESGYLALSALNVKDGYIDFLQDVHYGDQALYDKWMTGNELHKGQVLFTTEAPMGNVAQIPDNRRYILSQRTIAFDVKPELIIENFLAIVLRTPTVFASLTALSSGGTAKGVSQKSLATVEITIPVNLNEQEQLASIFSIIDHLITLHQRKYILYKNIKSDTEKQRKLCESEENLRQRH